MFGFLVCVGSLFTGLCERFGPKKKKKKKTKKGIKQKK